MTELLRSSLAALRAEDLCVPVRLDPAGLEGRSPVERRLSDLRESFADRAACEAILARGEDPVLYAVTAVEPANGDGQLHYGLGVLHPGKVGAEYFLTKGHLHAHRAAAEVYLGLAGEGAMLLEDELTGEARLVPLRAQTVVYVPGHTAHRTINTGSDPLVYLGVYPASAGHDYGAIARKNFAHVVVGDHDNRPILRPRTEFLASLSST